jgi:hypothetical protein
MQPKRRASDILSSAQGSLISPAHPG